MWGAKAGVQVSRRKFHTHIHLDYAKVEFLSKKKKEGNSLIYILASKHTCCMCSEALLFFR